MSLFLPRERVQKNRGEMEAPKEPWFEQQAAFLVQLIEWQSGLMAITANPLLETIQILYHYSNRFSTVFQLMTSQIALKYSALRFWYCRLGDQLANLPESPNIMDIAHTSTHAPKRQFLTAAGTVQPLDPDSHTSSPVALPSPYP